MKDENLSKLKSIFINALDIEEIEDIEELSQISFPKWDSLAQAILIAAIADEFSIDIGGREFEMFSSFKSIKIFLEEKGF